MAFLPLRTLAKLFSRAVRPRRRPARPAGLRPRLQVLEDRALPATVFWTNPLGGDWDTPANWSTGLVPGPSDDVMITSPTSQPVTHSMNLSDTINSLHVQGVTLTFSNGSLKIAAPSDTDSPFTLSGGILSLDGPFRTSGDSRWSGGTLLGSGGWTNLGLLTIAEGFATLNGLFTNDGTVAQTGRFLTLGTNGVVNNEVGALYDLQGDAVGLVGVSGRFNNFGTLRKSASSGTSTSQILPASNVGGTLDVQTGQLTFDTQGATLAGATFLVAPGATLNLQPGTLTGNFTGSGGGRVFVTGSGTVQVGPAGATFDLPSPMLVWGFANLNGGASGLTNRGTFTFFSGANHTLTGLLINAGVLEQPGVGSLSLSSSAAVVNRPGAVYDLQGSGGIFGPSSHTADAAFSNAGTFLKDGSSGTTQVDLAFNNAGTVAVSAGTLSLGLSVVQSFAGTLLGGNWVVDSGATLSIGTPGPGFTTNAADVTLRGAGSRFVQFGPLASNAGTLRLLDGQELTTRGALANSGAVLLAGATLTVAGDYTQTGGTTTLAGGTLAAQSTVDLEGGILSGFGTIAANVVNGAKLRPRPGGEGLVISGDYTQTASGTLAIPIGGTEAGTQYGFLQVGGPATLDGALRVRLIGGFQPAEGDTFTILTFAASSGDFASKEGLGLGGGLSFDPVFDDTSLALVTVPS
jgi:hypothetical protein